MTVSPSGGGTLFLTNESRDVVVDQPTRYPTSYDCFFISDRVSVKANANSGYKFDRWIIDPVPSGFNTKANPVEFTNNEPRRLTAIFVSGSQTPVPSAPTGVSASDGTYSSQIYVSWNASSDATSYNVYRSTSSTGLKPVVGTTSMTNYSDTDVSCDGTRYYYSVAAINSAGTSAQSSSNAGYCDSGSVNPPPPPPPGEGVTALSADQAKSEIDDSLGLIILDTRGALYYKDGHLLCAEDAVWNDAFEFINYDNIIKDYGMDVLLYDQDGTNILDAANYMAGEGFSTVYYISGGIDAWEAKGYEIVTSTDPCSIPPMANAGEDQTVVENTLVTLDGSASSAPDNGTLDYIWTQADGPSVAVLDPRTATPTFTAPFVQEGGDELIFYLKVINAQDVADTDSVSVFVTWTPVSSAPVAKANASPTVVDEGNPVTLSAIGSTDPDNDIESYLWQQTGGTPTVALSNAGSVAATFTAPDVAAQTTLTFRVTVTDEEDNSDTDTVSVVVNNLDPIDDPDAPIADAGNDAIVNESDTVTLDGSGSMAPGGTITGYQWLQTSGTTTVSLLNSNTISPSFIAPTIDAGQEILKFRLIVTNNAGQSSLPDEVIITVNNVVGKRPVADAGGLQTVYGGATVTLNGTAMAMEPGETITSYQWQQIAGTNVALSGADTPNPSFIAPQLTDNETLEFELTVTDSQGLSDSDSVKIVVDVTPPPVADAGDDLIVKEGDTVVLDGSLSFDNNNEGLKSYQWRQISGPQVALSANGDPQVQFEAPDLPGRMEVLIFELTVEDSIGLTSSDVAAVMVKNRSSSDSGFCFISAME